VLLDDHVSWLWALINYKDGNNNKNETTKASPWQHIFIEEAHSGEITDIRS
jgi:hypothetical protein